MSAASEERCNAAPHHSFQWNCAIPTQRDHSHFACLASTSEICLTYDLIRPVLECTPRSIITPQSTTRTRLFLFRPYNVSRVPIISNVREMITVTGTGKMREMRGTTVKTAHHSTTSPGNLFPFPSRKAIREHIFIGAFIFTDYIC